MLPIFFESRDGQSRRIAAHVAEKLSAKGIAAQAIDVKKAPPSHAEIAQQELFVLVAAIRYGTHLREAERAIDTYLATSVRPPLALASVNLTARKPARNTPETNRCLSKWITRRKLEPVTRAVFAGRLDYPHYKWWEKLAMQMIMRISGGVTDPTAVVEYTDWDKVDAWAAEIAAWIASGRAR